MTVAPFARSLDQEVLALLRAASLECLVCGEFVLHRGGLVACPECGAYLRADQAGSGSAVHSGTQAG